MTVIVSDIDGTFITSQERVTPRLKAVLARLPKDVPLIFATGRPARWVHPILEQVPQRPFCVCANGAVVYDPVRDEILHAETLSPAAMRTVLYCVRDVIDVEIAMERAGRSAFDHPDELFMVSHTFEHLWASDEHATCDEDFLLEKPAVKMLLRNPRMSSADMYQLVRPVIPEELAHITYSIDDGLLEVTAPGVNKAKGLTWLLDYLGRGFDEVIAFGDMANDIEMLQAAGHAVAMGTAPASVAAVADRITTTCDEDGVAIILEELLGTM